MFVDVTVCRPEERRERADHGEDHLADAYSCLYDYPVVNL